MSKEKRTRKVTVRLTPTEYEKVEKKCKQTTRPEVSDYFRNAVLGKPLVIKYRNESLDALMEEIIVLRQELNAIGHNQNQAVRKLHSLRQIPEFREWIQRHEVTRQLIEDRANHIDEHMSKISDKWLQG